VFPFNDPVIRLPPSLLTGSLGIGFPAFNQYYEGAKTSHALPASSVSFALRYHYSPRASGCFAPVDASSSPSTDLELVEPVCPLRHLGGGGYGISQVPREPQCASALLSDPGRIVFTKPIQCYDVAPAVLTTKAPTTISLFRGSITQLLHSLSTLRAAITDDYARLASGWWLTTTRWDCLPTGFLREVSDFTSSPSPGLRLARQNS
jgi:hypothetical protein